LNYIGMNNGESPGQTVRYCHIHLIPRRICAETQKLTLTENLIDLPRRETLKFRVDRRHDKRVRRPAIKRNGPARLSTCKVNVSYALAVATFSMTLCSATFRISRFVLSTNASLSARQVSSSRPTPWCPATSAASINATYSPTRKWAR